MTPKLVDAELSGTEPETRDSAGNPSMAATRPRPQLLAALNRDFKSSELTALVTREPTYKFDRASSVSQ
jgi:hypothetical protein